MFLPLGDENSDRKIIPFVNYFLVIINILVFIFLQDLGSNHFFTYSYAAVPEELITGKDIETSGRILTDPLTGQRIEIPGLQKTPIPVYLTILTSIFMHGSIAHIFGNMLFLWIFGDNIENKLGHLRYLFFYILMGALATFAHVFTTYLLESNPLIPVVGASGAISGILGAYIMLYPKKRVRILIFYFITDVPAFVALGLWFVFQIVSGFGMLASETSGGVAYGAHIGGFIAGFLLIRLFSIGTKV